MSFLIETPRLGLRYITNEDLDLFWNLAQNPQVIRHMDYIAFGSKNKTSEWVNTCIANNRKIPRESYNLVIVRKDTGASIGWIGMGEPDEPNKGDMDFGYALLPEFWGNGFAPEALQALIAFTFEHHSISTIYGECDSRNSGSIRVMEKAGMKELKRFEEIDETTAQKSLTVGFRIFRNSRVSHFFTHTSLGG